MKMIFACLCFSVCCFAAKPVVVDHNDLKTFKNNGNSLCGLATPALGAQEFEVWHSSIAAGSCTPRHTHETEEIFIFFKGEGKAVVGDEEVFYKAPCTLILPAHVPHQIFNLGDEPTDHIAVLGCHSEIVSSSGMIMQLPWRE